MRVLFLLLPCLLASAQEPSAAALARHDLAWITSARDFDASRLRPEQCADSLAAILYAQRELPVEEVELPLCPSKLAYLGLLDPCAEGLVPAPQAVQPAARAIVRPLAAPHHAWRYGPLLLLSREDGAEAQRVIHAVCRASELLAARLPRLYERLYAVRDDYQAAREQTPDAPWINLHRQTVIVLNDYPRYVAVSSYVLGPATPMDGPSAYWNTPLTALDPGALQAEGSTRVYGPDAARAFRRSLRDGLVETLLHEAMHNRIAAERGVDPFLERLKRAAGRYGNAVEEAAVTISSVRLAERALGISPEVASFYRNMFATVHLPALGLDPEARTATAAGLALLEQLAERPDGSRWRWSPERVDGVPYTPPADGAEEVSLEELFDLGWEP